MQFIKFKKENERSYLTYWVPTEQYNYNMICHIVRKPEENKEESAEQKDEQKERTEALIFETGVLVTISHQVLKERKIQQGGKILKEVYDQTTSQEPYQVVVNEPEDIARLVQWLNERTISE